MMSTTVNYSSDGGVNPPHLQGFVTLQALWTLVSLLAPENQVLLWVAAPIAIVFGNITQKINWRRLPTVTNIFANYLTLAVEVGSIGHWVIGGPALLREKLLILTLMVAGAVAKEVWAWLDRIITTAAAFLAGVEELRGAIATKPVPRRRKRRTQRRQRTAPTRPHRPERPKTKKRRASPQKKRA